MAENHMADVAALFGKKLDEAFLVKYEGEIFDCKFTKTMFKACYVGDELYNDDEFMMHCLVTGEAVVVND